MIIKSSAPINMFFLPQDSSDLMMKKFIAHIITAWERKELIVCTFMDLSKAFDSIDHHILLQKLSIYGIQDNSLGWLKSYLSDRQQQVKVNHIISKPSVYYFWGAARIHSRAGLISPLY